MKFNLARNLVATAVTATTVLSVASVPAQAGTLAPEAFENGTFSFDTNTTLNFNFELSKGKYKSNFGIYDVLAGTFNTLFSEVGKGYDPGSGDSATNKTDWLGTCGVTVLDCSESFTFLAGRTYQFFLTGPTNQFSSTPGNTTFTYDGGEYTYKSSGPTYNKSNPPIFASKFAPLGGALIAMNDTHAIDVDKNDFIVSVTAVPEPTTLLGLGLAAGAIATSRRRKTQAS